VAPVDVRLPKGEKADSEIDTVIQPDVLVVCDPRRVDRRGLRWAPDLIVEVLSPATASYDHQRKRQVYERAGVRVYWLVHPADRMVTFHRLQDGQFGRPDVHELAGETPIAVLPGVTIAWDALLQRLPKPNP
jgi:Uma2 family endonuclease